MSKKFDVIIIGSGIGGLTIASLLSKNKKVLLLEKNNNFGGYCAAFKRKGYRFESAVQAINGLYKGSPIYEVLKKSQALNGVKIVRPRHLYRSIFPDYDISVPQANINKYKTLLFSLFPDEKNNIINLFDTLKSIYLEMSRFYRKKTLAKSPFILKYGRRSLQELMDGFTKNKKLRAVISQYWMYRGLPPTKLSAITFAYIWYDYTANGSYFPKDGMHSIMQNLVDFIKNNNGVILHDREVNKLFVDFDRITELGLENSSRYEADMVISNIDVFKTFGMVVSGDTLDIESFLSKLKNNFLSISAFKIYLGLNIDVRKIGIKDYEIFVNPSYDAESMYQASLNNEFEKVPYSITIYSNLSDSFCKKGKSVVSIGLLSGYDFWRNLTRSEYKQKKEEMAEIILSRCEKVIPGLRKYIKVKTIATPLTMERYTGNSNGSIYGWNKKSLIEEIRFMNPTTPIKNLLLSSHWTKMGGGIGGVLLSSDRVYNLINNKA
ncbi:MAG: NAD(P)/FAD-dependent oxidoreductase [Candidatus Omnitrophica bacterium]|nr:NAD(P)/FAD-dependent oxidoreductase [Candidatus Omnitrophota bacterium]